MHRAAKKTGDAYLVKKPRVSLGRRCRIVAQLLAGLRFHDLRAARTFIHKMFPRLSLPVRLWRFMWWTLHQGFDVIPNGLCNVTFEQPVQGTPLWLAEGNPLANYPWQNQPDATLPESAEVVVVGAGFTGGALAYHWAKATPVEKQLVVLEMNDPASGASGRSAGEVVMGRYFALVQSTVIEGLQHSRPNLDAAERDLLALHFAKVYCRAAYKNAELIERTIREEGFDCDYVRKGWVQARTADEQHLLEESVRMGHEHGFTDWVKLSAQEASEKTGANITDLANFSRKAGQFHPGKWVWSLFSHALQSSEVRLFCRTKVLSIRDAGEFYEVSTSRGVIRAKHVVNATEAYTPNLHKQFRNVILPKQSQMAAGTDEGKSLKPSVALSNSTAFMGRLGTHIYFGSDETRIPDRQIGRNQPSRFITKYMIGELRRVCGWFPLRVTHEWSGTVGFTCDEYPIVGVMDGKRQYIIAGMCGSGTAISFNAARWTCNQIRECDVDEDDYPPSFFSPNRLLDPKNHHWPDIDKSAIFQD
jgi:glycine/D-amino acid oxidase-like deaminating enzyme